jgi:hypothetical protein
VFRQWDYGSWHDSPLWAPQKVLNKPWYC